MSNFTDEQGSPIGSNSSAGGTSTPGADGSATQMPSSDASQTAPTAGDAPETETAPPEVAAAPVGIEAQVKENAAHAEALAEAAVKHYLSEALAAIEAAKGSVLTAESKIGASREFSTVKTKLDEARMWLKEQAGV